MSQLPPAPPYPPTGQPFGQDPAQAAQWQYQTDVQHLRLLSIFYYVYAGLQVLGGCFGLFYIVLGLAIGAGGSAASSSGGRPQDADAAMAMGGVFAAIGGCLTLVAVGVSILMFLAASALRTQRRKTLCMVAAGFACISVPLGTILGIFTFVVLARPSVASLFAMNEAGYAPR